LLGHFAISNTEVGDTEVGDIAFEHFGTNRFHNTNLEIHHSISPHAYIHVTSVSLTTVFLLYYHTQSGHQSLVQ